MTERTEILVGKENIEKLKQSSVLIAGLGGVGAFAIEAIVRAGVENIVIIDGDNVSKSNINRQLLEAKQNLWLKDSEILTPTLILK